jgi:hypothetical protein
MERGRIEREVDAHVAKAGGLAELLGMGTMRTSRALQPGATRTAASSTRAWQSVRSRLRETAARHASATTSSPMLPSAGCARQAALLGQGHVRRRRRVDTYGTPAALSPRHASPTSSPRDVVASPAPRSAPTPHTNHTRPRPLPTSRGESMTWSSAPRSKQLKHIVGKLHMSMSDREVGEYLDVLEGTMQAYDRVDEMPDYLPEVRYPRTPGMRPSAAENPLGAWYVKSEVKGAPYARSPASASC